MTSQFKVGDRVRHERFPVAGTIEAIEPYDDDDQQPNYLVRIEEGGAFLEEFWGMPVETEYYLAGELVSA